MIQKNTKKINLQLKNKNKMNLFTKDFKNKQPNKKLNAKKVELFLMK